MTGKTLKLLVVDSSEEISEFIRLALQSRFRCEVAIASSGNKAIEQLEESPVDIVISDLTMSDGTGADLYAYLVSSGSKTRFILCTSDLPDWDQFRGDNFAEAVRKPDVVAGVFTAVRKILAETGSPELQAAEFCKIRVDDILKVNLTTVDLYLKLSDTKFVKVMHAEDTFSEDDMARYEAKNIQYLYIRRDDCAEFVEKYQRDLLAIAQMQQIKLESSFEISKNTLRTVRDLSRQIGFSEEVQALTKANVDLASRVIQEHPTLSELLKRQTIDPDDYIISHSVAVAHVAGGIAGIMGWHSDVACFKLALAAFLHDLSLGSEKVARLRLKTELISSSGEKQFSEKETDEFLEHPEKAAKFLEQMNQFLPDVDVILRQHHERPDGSGFPGRLNFQRISPLSSVFIVAEDLVTFSLEQGSRFTLSNFLSEFESEYKDGHFKKIINAMAMSAV